MNEGPTRAVPASTAGRTLTPGSHARQARLQARDAGEAEARTLAEEFAAAKAVLETATVAYGAAVRPALTRFRQMWVMFTRDYGPSSDYDAASSSRHTPQHLHEALGRLLAQSGLSPAGTSLRRGARRR